MSMEAAQKTQMLRRLDIPLKVYLILEDMAMEERKKVDNELIKAMITPKSLAQHILAEATQKHLQKTQWKK